MRINAVMHWSPSSKRSDSASIVYFKIGHFIFYLGDDFLISLKQATLAGSTLGVGIWIEAKLSAKKNMSHPTKIRFDIAIFMGPYPGL